jgi:hypothetical protein
MTLQCQKAKTRGRIAVSSALQYRRVNDKCHLIAKNVNTEKEEEKEEESCY